MALGSVLGVVALLLASSLQSAVPPALRAVHTIVTMGDSITQLGGSPKGYVTLIQNRLKEMYPDAGIELVNVGISGQKSTDMHARFQRDVLDRHPQMVTISVGVNDVWHNFRTPNFGARVPTGDSGRGVALPDYIREVEAMVTEAQRAGIKVMLVSPTLVYEDLGCAENKRLTEYVRAEREVAKRNGAVFVDLNRSFRETVAAYQRHAGKAHLLLTVDGVHMNDAGNALMAGEVLSVLGVPLPDSVSPR